MSDLWKPKVELVKARMRQIAFSTISLKAHCGFRGTEVDDFFDGKLVTREVAERIANVLWAGTESWKHLIDHEPFEERQVKNLVAIEGTRQKNIQRLSWRDIYDKTDISRGSQYNIFKLGNGSMKLIELISKAMCDGDSKRLEKIAIALGLKLLDFKVDLEVPDHCDTEETFIKYAVEFYRDELLDLNYNIDQISEYWTAMGISRGCIRLRIAVPVKEADLLVEAFHNGEFKENKVTSVTNVNEHNPRNLLAYGLFSLAGALVLLTATFMVGYALSGKNQEDPKVKTDTAQNFVFRRSGDPIVHSKIGTMIDRKNGVWDGWNRYDNQLDVDTVSVSQGERNGILVSCNGVSPPISGAAYWGQIKQINDSDLNDCSFDVTMKPSIGIAKGNSYVGAETVSTGILDANDNGWQLSISKNKGNDTAPRLKLVTSRIINGIEQNSVVGQGSRLLSNWKRGTEITFSIERYAGGIEFYASIPGFDREKIAFFESDQAMGPTKQVLMRAGGYRKAEFDVEFLSAIVYRLEKE